MVHTEKDVDLLIDDHLKKCDQYPNVCALMETAAGKERVKKRIKQIIFDDGNPSIKSAIAIVETELLFTE